MPDYSAGTASVDIKPSFLGFVRELRDELDRVQAELGVEIKPDTAGFAAALETELNRVRARIDVEVGVDEQSLTDLQKMIQARLDAMHLGVDIHVGADTRTAADEIAALRALAGQQMTIDVDANTRVAADELAAFRQLAGRQMTIDVDADTSAAAARIARLRRSIGSGGGGSGDNNSSSFGAAGLLNAGALGIANLPAAATAVASIGSDLQALAQTATLLPAIFAGAAAGVATLVVGFQGMKDAFGADPKKASAAMDGMASSAREVVSTVRSFGAEWAQVQKSVQGRMFEGVADPLRNVISTQLPVLEQGMGGLASKFGDGFKIALGELGNAKTSGALTQIFGNTTEAAGRLNGSITPIINTLRTLASTGSSFLPELAQGFTNLATRFDGFITKSNDSGDLSRWMREGIDAATKLGSIIGNLGSSLGSFLKASKGDGDSFLTVVDRLTTRMSDWLKSSDGKTQMRAFFKDGHDQLDKWLPVLQSVGTILKSVYEASQTWSSILMPFLQAASSLLAGHDALIQTILISYLAFKTFSPIFTGIQTAIGDANTRLDTFRNGMNNAATGGASRFSSAMSGLGAMLGPQGIFGIALVAATIGIGFLIQKHNEAKQAADEQRAALEALGATLDKQSGKVTEETVAQAAGTLGKEGFLTRASSLGVNTHDFTQASLGLDPSAKGAINDRLTQIIQEQKGSAGNTWTQALTTGLSDQEIAQALQGVPEAVTKYADALNAAQAKITNSGSEEILPDLTTLKSSLNDVGESAATLGGKMNDLQSNTAKMGESVRQVNEAKNGIHDLTDQGKADFDAFGVKVESVTSRNTLVLKSATDEQIAKLRELGNTAERMPDGTVTITLDDAKAKRDIQEIVKPETKVVTVEQRRLDAGIADPSVRAGAATYSPESGYVHYASGGPVTGGTPGVDSVPLLGMPGEHMLTTDDVNRLGGQAGVYRFRAALKNGTVGRMADGGEVLPQAPLPGRRSDKDIQVLNAQAAVDQANTERNKVYNDPASTDQQKLKADLNYQSSQNSLTSARQQQSSSSSSAGGAGATGGVDLSLQGFMSKGATILANGILGFFGLENSFLSSNNVYNKALSTTVDYYSKRDQQAKQGQQGDQQTDGYEYQPQNLPVDQQKTASDSSTSASIDGTTSASADSATKPAAGEAGWNGGVEAWRPTFAHVLDALGMPASWLSLGLSQMMTESGGNPTAINNSDSNAAKGTPSKGLMQVIDPTFNAYKSALYPDSVWNPSANIAAALRYTVSRYGGPQGVWGQGHGYDQGGIANGAGLLMKQTIKPERVLDPRQTVAFESMLPLLETMQAPPPMPAFSQPSGSNVTRDHSVNFHAPVAVMDMDHLVAEQDRWASMQSQGALAGY